MYQKCCSIIGILTENCVTFTEKGLNFAESSENLPKKEVEIHRKKCEN